MDFPAELKGYVDRVEKGIDRFLPPGHDEPARLHAAMRYAVQAGGKRLRPVLLLAAAEVFPANDASPGERADPLQAAVAIECVHTYSLVHDDLPCMDDDDLRRGRPTVHHAFDEATALLAGDALLTHAFVLLAQSPAKHPALVEKLVWELADAAGSRRLLGGQMADLQAEKKADITPDELRFIHLNKTAAMIEAALVMGGCCGGAGAADLETLRRAGRHLGLAFQIMDDVLDATADTRTLGKTAGKDAKADKATYVKFFGVEKARAMAEEHSTAAIAEFKKLPGGAAFLVALTEAMAGRTK